MMHPETELKFISDEIGFGVFARQAIPKGTITWAGDELDQKFSPQRIAQMHPACRVAAYKYSFVDSSGMHVLCWDHGRYVNHSCEANCLSAGFQFEFAIRDIAAGEELTDDYGLMNLDEAMQCHCGSRHCRKTITPNEFERCTEWWDGLVAESFEAIGRVPQPLWPLVIEKEEVGRVLAGSMAIPSCALLRFHAAVHRAQV
jgi:hypothetical protein